MRRAFDPVRSAAVGGLLVELMARDRKKSGDWAKPKPFTMNRRDSRCRRRSS